jgi:hypothetical protein
VSEEWTRVENGPGSAIRDRRSLGKTHSLELTLCLVSEEWSRLRNQDSYPFLLEKNSPDRSSLMFYLLREHALPRSHRCEWKNGLDDSFYIITLFMCMLISDDFMKIVCL